MCRRWCGLPTWKQLVDKLQIPDVYYNIWHTLLGRQTTSMINSEDCFNSTLSLGWMTKLHWFWKTVFEFFFKSSIFAAVGGLTSFKAAAWFTRVALLKIKWSLMLSQCPDTSSSYLTEGCDWLHLKSNVSQQLNFTVFMSYMYFVILINRFKDLMVAYYPLEDCAQEADTLSRFKMFIVRAGSGEPWTIFSYAAIGLDPLCVESTTRLMLQFSAI